jgi:hypothetical protein
LTRVALFAAAAAAVFLAGSASGATRYQTQMRTSVRPQLTAALAGVAKARKLATHYPAKPTAAREARAALLVAEPKLALSAKRLAAIAPPSGIASAHAEVLRGVRELEVELRPIIARMKIGYLVAGKGIASLKGLVVIHAGLTTIAKHGFNVGIR